VIDNIFNNLPPAFIMIIGGLLMPIIGRYARMALSLILPIITMLAVWRIPVGAQMLNIEVAGFAINPIYAYSYTHIFAIAFIIAAFAGALFGLQHCKKSEISAAFVYAGAAIGVTFCGDFISLFFYMEMMAIASIIIIFASDHEGSKRSGIRYALVHFLGGILLMCGIIVHSILVGDVVIARLEAEMLVLFPDYALDMNGLSIWLILMGILINAAVPPISAWLSDSYPRSSPFGGVFLSAFTTKTAVFVLLIMFAGTEALIYAGLVMIFYGIIYSVLENDMRRILSYSIITQVGFMLIGIGIGTPMALNGVAIYAFAHIMYKALLFMSAGSVLHVTGKNRMSDFFRLSSSMKLTAVCNSIGVLTMVSLPFTSGFVTKSMIFEAAIHEGMQNVWLLMTMGSAGIVMTAVIIKFPWFSFLQKGEVTKFDDPPLNMQLAMIFLSLLCIAPAIPGVAEATLYKMLPSVPEFSAYTGWHIVSHLQLILFSILAVFLMLPVLKRTETITLDFDWFYRSLGRYIVLVIGVLGKLPARISVIVAKKAVKKGVRAMYSIHHPEGVLAKNRSLGVNVLWMVALLGVYLVIYYY
jgi:multicomponent Na+:H+ antiporter subunit D